MKIEYTADFTDSTLGRGKKGTQTWVTNATGNKLIRKGYAVEVADSAKQLEASTKDKPIEKKEIVRVDIPDSHDKTMTGEEINKYAQTSSPARKPWWKFW